MVDRLNIIMMKYNSIAAIGLLLLMAGCEADTPATFPQETGPGVDADEVVGFRHDGTLTFIRDGEPQLEINIEIAATDSSRTRGLMQRTSLPERSGMLFIFDGETPRSFWMANTPLSLDIMFADADSQIVTVRKYTRPMSQQSVTSTAPAQFVVEVPAGFSDSHGIVEGDRIRWEESGER